MDYYIETNDTNILSKLDKFKKGNELFAISPKLEFRGKTFYDVQIIKQSPFNLIGRKCSGFLILNENYETISSSDCPEKLLKMIYFFSTMIDKNNKISLIHLSRTAQEFKKDEFEYKSSLDTLKLAIDETTSDYRQFTNCYTELYTKKIQNSNKINSLLNSFTDSIKNNGVLTENDFDTLYEEYKIIMGNNLKRIKIIYSYSSILKKIYKICHEDHKKIKNKLKSNKKGTPNSKLYISLKYNLELLESYKNVLPMTINQYLNYVEESEHKLLGERRALTRNIN